MNDLQPRSAFVGGRTWSSYRDQRGGETVSYPESPPPYDPLKMVIFQVQGKRAQASRNLLSLPKDVEKEKEAADMIQVEDDGGSEASMSTTEDQPSPKPVLEEGGSEVSMSTTDDQPSPGPIDATESLSDDRNPVGLARYNSTEAEFEEVLRLDDAKLPTIFDIDEAVLVEAYSLDRPAPEKLFLGVNDDPSPVDRCVAPTSIFPALSTYSPAQRAIYTRQMSTAWWEKKPSGI